MKAVLTIELDIPDFDKLVGKAEIWELENNYKYDDAGELITDYLLTGDGYSIAEIDLTKEIE